MSLPADMNRTRVDTGDPPSPVGRPANWQAKSCDNLYVNVLIESNSTVSAFYML